MEKIEEKAKAWFEEMDGKGYCKTTVFVAGFTTHNDEVHAIIDKMIYDCDRCPDTYSREQKVILEDLLTKLKEDKK